MPSPALPSLTCTAGGTPCPAPLVARHALPCTGGRLGYRTRLFNIGEYRRTKVGAEQHADFFDPNNKQAVAVREEMAVAALTDMFKFFAEGGQAAIYDGTNSIRSVGRWHVDWMGAGLEGIGSECISE
jgi:hypothetical protein